MVAHVTGRLETHYMRNGQISFLQEMSAAELAQIYDDLNAPSAAQFRKALARKGIKARAKDIEEFVRSKSEKSAKKYPKWSL